MSTMSHKGNAHSTLSQTEQPRPTLLSHSIYAYFAPEIGKLFFPKGKLWTSLPATLPPP